MNKIEYVGEWGMKNNCYCIELFNLIEPDESGRKFLEVQHVQGPLNAMEIANKILLSGRSAKISPSHGRFREEPSVGNEKFLKQAIAIGLIRITTKNN